MAVYLLHPAVVHFPIAFLIAASASGLAYIHWRRLEALRTIAWWAMGAGWITLIVAIVTGIVAQGGLPPDAPYRSVLNWHTTSGLILAGVYGDLLYRGWLHNSKQGKRHRAKGNNAAQSPGIEFLADPRQKWLLTLELIAGMVLVIVSGYLGGELVYTWGVNVNAP